MYLLNRDNAVTSIAIGAVAALHIENTVFLLPKYTMNPILFEVALLIIHLRIYTNDSDFTKSEPNASTCSSTRTHKSRSKYFRIIRPDSLVCKRLSIIP